MRSRFNCLALLCASVMGLASVTALAQQTGDTSTPQGGVQSAPQNTPLGASQPPPFTAPNPPTPAATEAPGQQSVPGQQMPQIDPDAPLPQTNKTTIDLRSLAQLSRQPESPDHPAAQLQQTAHSETRPQAESPSALATSAFSLVGAYRPVRLPAFSMASTSRLHSLVRDGKLYLSLHDAVALAIENNLDVEIKRYNLSIADTDLTRAKGGGNLRGIDYTIEQLPPGVGAVTSPLLVTAASGSQASNNVTVTDLSQVTQTGSGSETMLGENGTSTFAPGPAIPLYDPIVSGEAAYLRRSDQDSLVNTSTTSNGTSGASDTSAVGAQDYVSIGVDYQQGFSTGAALDLYINNASQVLFGSNSQLNSFHAPSSSVTFTQPLLRGLGRAVNLRFIRIANLNRNVSELLFKQQLLETLYGISRLYFDLVSLGENVGVKEQSLAAAQRLFNDDNAQVEEGTLAPIELTRAKALLSSSRLDLIQARGEYRQQEVILREQLLRKMSDPETEFSSIIPTDRIVVPDELPAIDVPQLTVDALANRPDLLQASFQVNADADAAKGTRNGVRPQLNAYVNVQARGSSLEPFQTLGSPGNGVSTVPPALTQGGERLSTIYQGGVQLTMPLRNRIAQADSARDAIQLRQAEGRTMKLENDIRQQVENASIALETAHQAYAAAVESTNYQQQLLQAEIDKFSVGESTNYLVIQDQAYLAQARSTEVAARSDWMKAQLSLDRALGNLLEKNNITLEDAVQGRVR